MSGLRTSAGSAAERIKEKRPAFTFKNGAEYEGEWVGQLREGYGVQKWADGATYKGDWKDNMAQGKGKFVHVDGDMYVGDWDYD